MGKWVDLGKKIVMRKYLLPILLIGFWGCEDDTSNDSLDDMSYSNCFDGNDTYGGCLTCGYYADEEDAQGANDCITCLTGYEIDVYFTDCTGYCVPEGTAINPISESDCQEP